jgi:hypothetical protein
VRKRGDDFTVGAEHTHRIASVMPGTFTLVTAGPARRAWGFWAKMPSSVEFREPEAEGPVSREIPPRRPFAWVSAASRGIEAQPEDVIRD